MAKSKDMRTGAILRKMWIEDNRARFVKAKTERQITTALNRAYDQAVYHQIIMALEKDGIAANA